MDVGSPNLVFQEGWADILHLRFDDIDESIYGRFVGITNEQARSIVSFLDRNEDCSVVAHCYYGQSRSAAIALYAGWRNGVVLSSKTGDYNKFVWKQLMRAHLVARLKRFDLMSAIACIQSFSGPKISTVREMANNDSKP